MKVTREMERIIDVIEDNGFFRLYNNSLDITHRAISKMIDNGMIKQKKGVINNKYVDFFKNWID